ncbi:hypothetical protein TRVA0_009S03202 [Trichomonascus vanleenenianus]|uniref:uncharacterized protein n=1 Tax=Trichomonascus vanleenenianus TaxID=2268995 RepID=UPI003ECB616F
MDEFLDLIGDRLETDSSTGESSADEVPSRIAEDSEEDVEWEDVDLERKVDPEWISLEPSAHVHVQFNKVQPPKSKKSGPSGYDRALRQTIHLVHLQSMLCHGFVRNCWINNPKLQKKLKRSLPKELRKQVKKHLIKKKYNLLEILNSTTSYFFKRFKVTKPALRRLGYHFKPQDIPCYGEKVKSIRQFMAQCLSFEGSLDSGAQIFAAMLKSLGLNRIRLVYSPPLLSYDYQKPESYRPPPVAPKNEPEKTIGGVYIPAIVKRLDNDLDSPSFWVEVWNPETNSFVVIDPVISGMVGISPQELRLSHQSIKGKTRRYYAVSYSDNGEVEDVTQKYMPRRPLSYMNPTGKSYESVAYTQFQWYLTLFNNNHNVNILDVSLPAESELPVKITDYVNHPIFKLERHIGKHESVKQDAKPYHILKLANGKENVYLRSDIQELKSIYEWQKVGREIRDEEKPAREETTDKHGNKISNDLYTIDQTEIAAPRRINENGDLPETIEAFVPCMVPLNMVHITAENADLVANALNIPYSHAVVGHQFKTRKDGNKKRKEIVGCIYDGILILKKDHERYVRGYYSSLK